MAEDNAPLIDPTEFEAMVEKVAPAAKEIPAPGEQKPPEPKAVEKPNVIDEPKKGTAPTDPLAGIPKDVLPEKKVAPKPEERIDAEKIKVEDFPQAARTNVGNLRKQMIADQRRIAALEKAGIKFEEKDGEIVVTGGSAVKQEEYEALQKRATEQETILERTNILESRGFKEKFVQPLLQQKKLVFELAAGLAPDKFKDKVSQDGFLRVIDQLSEVPMANRVEYLKKYFPDSVGSFIPLFQKIDELNGAGNAALADWKKTKDELGTQQRVALSEQTREAKTLMLKAGLDDVTKGGFWMFKKTSGVDDGSKKWNEQVGTLEQQVAKIFDSDDPKLQTQAIVRGVAAEYLLGLSVSMQKRIEELQEELSQYETADPSIRGQRRSGGGKPSIPGSMTAAEAAAAVLAQR